MNALTKIENTALSTMQETELLAVLGSSLYPGAKADSIRMVLGYCRAAGLDPMQKPVHIVPMNVKKPGTRDDYEWRDTIMPGIGLYRTQAARSGELAGIGEPEFGPEKTLTVGNIVVSYPEWCKVTVTRALSNGREAKFTATEYWIENYATAGRETQVPNAMWKKRPRGQIAKCAQAQALRMAFPEMTGAQPTADEMEGQQPILEDGTPRAASAEPQAAPQPYSEEQFKANLPKWREVIEGGRKTAAQIIAMVSSKAPLSETQKATLLSIKSKQATDVIAKSSAEGDPFTAPTHAEVAGKIAKAADLDALNLAGDLIKSVTDEGHRAELKTQFEQREAELKA